ncbi:MAG: hypothetical protein KKG59_02095 [Nanoarchaeota archaeon]|nr:hypothetical protein [Nanoarchaeota archaeon]
MAFGYHKINHEQIKLIRAAIELMLDQPSNRPSQQEADELNAFFRELTHHEDATAYDRNYENKWKKVAEAKVQAAAAQNEAVKAKKAKQMELDLKRKQKLEPAK